MKKTGLLLIVSTAILAAAPRMAAASSINAYLYNPSRSQIVLEYPYKRPADQVELKPTLVFHGDGIADGAYQLSYAIESRGRELYRGQVAVKVESGQFDNEIELKEQFPTADRVSWRLAGSSLQPEQGFAALAWSHFHGRVHYKNGMWHSTTIDLLPTHFRAPGRITVPVADDGTFDALVPARVYAIVNVNGTGYIYDSLERWAWNYDLTRDREDDYTVGSTELYSARVFEVQGGPNTIFLFFRPTSLARVHRFDLDGDGLLNESEMKGLQEATKRSPTAIGPELKPEDVVVWLDGTPLKVARLDQLTEASEGGGSQVDYLVQCFLPERIRRGVWHRLKFEVTSRNELRGQMVTDFGQSSVDFLWP